MQFESFRFDCPSFADELVGRKAVEGLEPSGEGVGGEEVVEVPNEPTAGIVIPRPLRPRPMFGLAARVGLDRARPAAPTAVASIPRSCCE